MKAKNTKFCRLGPFPLTDLRILSSSSCFGVFLCIYLLIFTLFSTLVLFLDPDLIGMLEGAVAEL